MKNNAKSRKVWCFGTEYELIYVDDIGEGRAGLYDYEKKTIYVKKCGKDKVEEMHTTIHELTHGLSYECSWHQVISPEVLELIADQVATLMVKNFDIRWRKKPKKK